MGFDVGGLIALTKDLNELAQRLDNHSAKGIRTVKYILQSGAVPILKQAMANVHPVDGDLEKALKIGNVTRKRNGTYTVTIGVTKGECAYANPVEFGHGGPHPAPAHPFIRPAYDEKVGEAFSIIKQQLAEAVTVRGL